jgi:hypothetical protein
LIAPDSKSSVNGIVTMVVLAGTGAGAGVGVGAGVWAVAAVAQTRQTAAVKGKQHTFEFIWNLSLIAELWRNHFAPSVTGVNWPMGLSLMAMSS